MSIAGEEEQADLDKVAIDSDTYSHIQIKDPNICQTECKDKPCSYFCPSQVYSWQEKEERIVVHYERCIECLACPFGCPHDNIDWQFPRGGYGVDYHKSR